MMMMKRVKRNVVMKQRKIEEIFFFLVQVS